MLMNHLSRGHSMETSNEYLNQVVQEQAQVEGELKARQQRAGGLGRYLGKGVVEFKKGIKGLEDEDEGYASVAGGSAGQAIHYRITGFWRWKTVVVPPN